MNDQRIITPATQTGMMGRIERAAERGPQWVECETCEGGGCCNDGWNGWVCEECKGACGYWTDPVRALELLHRRAMQSEIRL